MRILLAFGLFLILISCGQTTKNDPADAIVNKGIAGVGGKILNNATIAFDFRDTHYSAKREKGNYSLTRCSDPACKDTVDVVTNEGFERTINGKRINLADSTAEKYSNSVNSVHYFSVLPYGLDNEAVKKEIADTVQIRGKIYYEVKVSFKQKGGGKDYEDEYMYWINTQDFKVDYLAYNYHVNEGGTRFREAYNPREINGVRVVDYRNYEPKQQFPPLQSLDSLFENGKLKLLSRIDLENVEVTKCPNC
ncbi:DUF6503 family protein [Flavimarina sp. Hel_I_48]|uniref:DUF6503 family protein n=1 Tax=Flavimarina sp. Hel_I_48 TaxID=1392488 RepID=UPI0004DF6188|nr:DUF6503 family protein [Flavimarina sp. Hel_I_48]